ncbi:ribonucleotide reductase N-terminal alpha domain-containing protein [Clostridium sp. MT-14]|uniref:ribonucleotide reductase N-terminal alpha domain-containing protein n=1 Tax=Clostridium sp. MT-14 TaxID=3348360 RepID=UPI0035F22227
MAKLNDNALKLLEKRYYLRDSKTGKIIEHSPEDLFSRVAKYIASAEKEKELQDKWTKEFFDVMNNQLFMPNTPTLVNAGKDKCLSACSVIGRYPDSLEGIYKYLWYNAKLTKYGCGVGQDLSNIRPKGEIIKTSGGKSAGVINWMHNIQTTAATTIQGDTARRAANMVSLRFNHPDIEEFIDAKKENSQLFSAMNISVIIKDEEFKKALNGEEIWLQWNKKKYKKVNAKTLLDKIFTNAWSNGEPGLIFLDRMNEGNPFNLLDDTFNETNKHYIITTNPCVTGDTLILTDKGYFKAEDLYNKEVNVWNGFEFSKINVKITGKDQQILKINFSDGSLLKCTPYHKFCLKGGTRKEAKDLKIGDKLIKWSYPIIEGTNNQYPNSFMYTQGFFSGDGSQETNRDRKSIWLYDKKIELLKYLEYERYNKCTGNRIFVKISNNYFSKNYVPSANLSVKSRLNWLAGLLDSDGSLNSEDGSLSITSINHQFLMKTKLMINTLGCHASVSLNKLAGTKDMPNGKGSTKKYETQKVYRLIINATNVKRLMNLGLNTHRVSLIANPNRDASRFIRITSVIKDDNIAPYVYCFTEPKRHTGCFNGIVTAQCGEQPLEQWELCVLGSINLENIYNETKNDVDYSLLKRTIETSIRFLDNSITVNEFVLPEFKDKVLSNRKIGLGVTGFAHLLIKLGIQYDSDEALKFIDKLFKFIQQTAEDVDEKLAKEKGVFPSWKDSIFGKKNIKRRNATITTQAPTGSISTILGTESYGIEPLFSIGYIRRIVDGEILEINKLFKQKLHQVINDSDKEKNIVKQCIDAGTTNLDCVPKELKKLFRCANDISPEWHIKIMAQLQKYYENAVSKTVNLPETATPEDVKNAYTLAFALNCKGITVYRNNSIEDQTIQIGNKNNDKKVPYEVVSADDLPRGFIENVPPDLTYRKYKLYTGCGTLYFFVGIDEYEGKIYDCFTNTNGVGGCVVNTQANSRLLSTAIRYGAPIEYLIEQLQKAGTCPSYQYKRGLQNGVNHILHMSLNKFNTNDIKDKELREEIEEYTGQPLSKGKSCSSAIANILKNILDEFKNTEYIKNEKEDFKISIKTNPIKSDMGKCPVCGEPIILAEGCKSCPSCGWSRCN